MKIYGMTKEQLESIEIDNVEIFNLSHISKNCLQFRLKPLDSKLKGSRVSPGLMGKQRRIAASCWHSYRDFMIEVFDINSNARIKTAFADYKGKENFENDFSDTYYHNIGNYYQTVYYGDCCNCN